MTIVLQGFDCTSCGGWTGTEKENFTACRFCGTPREPTMRRVILESPYADDVDANVRYAQVCVLDCLRRGDAAIAAHLLYTQDGILDDLKPDERSLGMRAGFAWTAVAQAVVVYTDRGISKGMEAGIARAKKHGVPVEMRTLGSVPPTEMVSPEKLRTMLLAVGLEVPSPMALVEHARSDDDVRTAATWARAEAAWLASNPPRLPGEDWAPQTPRPLRPAWLAVFVPVTPP